LIYLENDRFDQVSKLLEIYDQQNPLIMLQEFLKLINSLKFADAKKQLFNMILDS
jgi:hypothetical protein